MRKGKETNFLSILLNFISVLIFSFLIADISSSLLGYLILPKKGEFKLSVPGRRDEKKKLPDEKPILERNLFGALVEVPKAKEEIKKVIVTPAKVPQLVGALVSKRGSFAFLKEGGKISTYREGERTKEGFLVYLVGKDYVLLKRGAKTYRLSLYKEENRKLEINEKGLIIAGVRKSGGNRWFIDKDLVESQLKNTQALLSQALVVPDSKNGGLRIDWIQDGSILGKIGLREGDVIKSINGQSVNDPSKLFSIYESLRSGEETEVTVQFLRDGVPKSFTYEIR